jgi:predicted transcriptional regulator
MRLLNDPSLLLVRELGFTPGSLAELAQRTGMANAQLARHLGALYMVGAITTDPKRAPPPRVVVESGEWDSSFGTGSSTTVDSGPGAEATVKLTASRANAPAASLS